MGKKRKRSKHSEKRAGRKAGKAKRSDNTQPCCGLPTVPERKIDDNIDPNRLSLIRYNEKKWVNGTVLHYHFLTDPPQWRGAAAQQQVVRDSFREWKDIGIGLQFEEVTDPLEAEIRIAFEGGSEGSWSYVGRDAIDLIPDRTERTMNFGWDLTTAYGHDTARHEIGHALGFPHEHQNPHAGITWNEDNVYAYFGGPPNYWPRSTTEYNVLRKVSPQAVQGSAWDKDSIMHYWFEAGLIDVPEEYRDTALVPDPGLSPVDRDEVKKFYPETDDQRLPELKPYLSHLVNIDPGKQLDFVIKPRESRWYTMRTFGTMDTVMVLFEDVNGEPVYIAGNDDSGTDRNANIAIRLLRDRTYYLRVRLYYALAQGHGAVMLW